MEYSSLTDFDSKLNALKDPNCPGEIIDKIVMDEGFPWGSDKAEVAKDLIASHKNTNPEQLENLFNNAANKHQKDLILKNPNCPKHLKPILDKIDIKLEGLGHELCQDTIEKEKYESYKNNYDDWNVFCADELGLDGYWDFNNISHITGLTTDNCTITIRINGENLFEGDYWALQEKLFEDDSPENNKNVSKDYGKHIDKENDKYLVTTRTSEFFEIHDNISIENFDVFKLGFLMASTDELGYGYDYGDYFLGFRYDDEDYYFEYPGGVGSIEYLDIE